MGLSKFAPSLGAGTIAIFLGMLVGNLFLGQKVFQKGYKFSETNKYFTSFFENREKKFENTS